jgi:putative NADH-flavin reductase
MRIVVFGAGGAVGQRIVREALERGHQVTAAVRDVTYYDRFDPRIAVVRADATDPATIAAAATGTDVVVSAVSPRVGKTGLPAPSLTAVARAFIASGVTRLIIVGGAGSLLVPGGKPHMDEPDFPAIYKPEAMAQRDALTVCRAEGSTLEWTYISPAEEMFAGQRTGAYRVGGDHLLTDASGHSRISYEDYAVAVVDTLERHDHIRERITVAY